MAASQAGAWSDLFVGTVGASAMLAGLVFIGIPIDLDKIVVLRGVRERGLEAIGLLFGVLVMSTLVLVPSRCSRWHRAAGRRLRRGDRPGVLNAARWRRLDRRFRVHLMAHMVLGRAAVALFALAGPTLILGTGGGLYQTAPAVISSFGAAIYNAWVLPVEIVH